MNDQDKSNLLYFSDDEIITGKTDNKKVFVTKRINGKETHIKQKSIKKEEPKETEYKRVPNTQGFNFEREIVIGVNNKKPSKNNKSFNKPNIQKKKAGNTKKSKKDIKKRNKHKGKIEVENKKIERKNKHRKKSPKSKMLITAISLIFMIIAMVIMALVTPAFNIQEIKVQGNSKVTTTNIINLSRIKIGQNIFQNNKNKIRDYIKENQYIENVEIKRILPGTINLIVKERKPEYQVKLISSYIYIDKQGNILENAQSQENAIVLEGLETSEENLINGKKLDKIDVDKLNDLSKIKEILSQIDDLELSEIKINIKKENDFIIYLKKENKKIYIGDSSNLSNKALYIKKILENEKEHSGTIFINGNLNEGFKPYFREEEYKD